jgi:hypothetical protein
MHSMNAFILFASQTFAIQVSKMRLHVNLFWEFSIVFFGYASLYISPEGKRIDLVLVGYNRRVLVLLQKLSFLESD